MLFLEYTIFVSFSQFPFILLAERDFFYKFLQQKSQQKELFDIIKSKVNNSEQVGQVIQKEDLYSLFFFNQNDLCEQMPKSFLSFLKSNNIGIKNITEAIVDVGPGNLTSNRIMSCFFYPIFKLNKNLKIKIIDSFSFYFNSQILGSKLRENIKINSFFNTKKITFFMENEEVNEILNYSKFDEKILIITNGRKDDFFCKLFINSEEKNIMFSANIENINKVLSLFKEEDVIFCNQNIRENLKLNLSEFNIFYEDFLLDGIFDNYNKIEYENKPEFKLSPIYLTKAV